MPYTEKTIETPRAAWPRCWRARRGTSYEKGNRLFAFTGSLGRYRVVLDEIYEA